MLSRGERNVVVEKEATVVSRKKKGRCKLNRGNVHLSLQVCAPRVRHGSPLTPSRLLHGEFLFRSASTDGALLLSAGLEGGQLVL